MPVVDVQGRRIAYQDVGAGPVLVFVHGIFVNADVWSDVVARLSDRFRCIAVTLPIGGHVEAWPADADRSPRAIAALIPQLLETLDLQDVTVVANDSGGGLLLVALDSSEPGLRRISRLVLTNCDSYEDFPPKSMRPMVSLARLAPWLLRPLLGRLLQWRGAQRGFFRSVAHTRLPDDRLSAFFTPLRSPAVQRDLVEFTGGLHRSVALAAAPAIERFTAPVLLAWGEDCKFFPLPHARRLAAAFPAARIAPIPDAMTYVMIDAPGPLADLITDFTGDAHE
jgi:pimeloyl-ACP methyl ester carboxylesterase